MNLKKILLDKIVKSKMYDEQLYVKYGRNLKNNIVILDFITENESRETDINEVYEFINELLEDDRGSAIIGDYIVYFEGFTPDCWEHFKSRNINDTVVIIERIKGSTGNVKATIILNNNIISSKTLIN